jgi:hypothetical protein
MTSSEAHDYATKDMLLGEAGTLAFFRFLRKICAEQYMWEAAAESVIINDRRTGKCPDDEARRYYLLDSNEGLWILTQQELAKLHPSSTPQDPRATTHEGYCSGIEAGVARDTMSALELLELNNRTELTLLAKLGRVRELSYLKFVIMANLKATWDKLLQLQEVILTLPASHHFQHYLHNCEHNIGDCYDWAAHAPTSIALQSWGRPTSKALQRWGLRVQSAGMSKGNGASPMVFARLAQDMDLAEPGYRSTSGSFSSTSQDSTAIPQAVESTSKSGREGPS